MPLHRQPAGQLGSLPTAPGQRWRSPAPCDLERTDSTGQLNAIETGIVGRLVDHLAAAGFKPVAATDWDEAVSTTADVCEVVYQLGAATIHFLNESAPEGGPKGSRRGYVFLVAGNGEDIVSDYAPANPEGAFCAAMAGFES